LRLHRALLRLWRVVPLPRGLRGFILWCANQRFLIGVVGIVWDGEGRLLLARHPYLPPPGWSLPGGWLGADETPEQGVARELTEELGLQVEVGPLVGWAQQRLPRHFTLGFRCWVRGGAFRTSAEVLEVGYFTPEQALRLVPPELRPLVRMAAERYAATGVPHRVL
jgi:ADP-ribose pyrophosphatase YjhB (NUDIX family)